MPEFTLLDWEGKIIGRTLCEHVSDGHHTHEELYQHRYALFAALIKVYDSLVTPLGPTSVRAWKSKVHHDGTMFAGSFIAGLTKGTIDKGEIHITYHLPLSWWDRFKCIEVIAAPPYDGHMSAEVVQRLIEL